MTYATDDEREKLTNANSLILKNWENIYQRAKNGEKPEPSDDNECD